jgi:hypothetical protein
MTDPSLKPKPSRLIPVTKWNQHHPWPTISGLRWLIFNADTGNGFDKVVVRVNGRVLIDETAFFAWVQEQQPRKATGGRS